MSRNEVEETSMVSSITAKELPLNKVFSSDYSFEIPSYQRPYSWQVEHALQLLDDLTLFALKDEPFNKLSPYFLGSIVLIKELDQKRAKVVDGQQRLTTFTILFSTLRKVLTDKVWKVDITEYIYEKGNVTKGTKDNFRLRLRAKDQPYFNSIIQVEDGLDDLDLTTEVSESQQRIRENASELVKKLEEYTQEQLQTLAKFIFTRCFVVIVSSTDEDSAFRIFNVLNDRGLNLSHADILKSEVLEKIEKINSSLQETYTSKWETAEETLGIDNFKELFNHIRPIFAKKKAEESILKEIRKHANPTADPIKFIDRVILPFSEVYSYILKCNYPAPTFADKINGKLRWLQRVENTDWIPCCLLYLSTHKTKPGKMFEFLCQLERLAIGMEILSFNIYDRIGVYSNINTMIENNEDVLATNSHFYFVPKEEEKIKEKLMSNTLYGKRYLKLLLKIDEKLSSGGATYDYPILSIEHVLPQTPKEGSTWTSWFKDEEHEKLVNSLGNFVLLTTKKNSSARNFEFDHKKDKYFKQNGISPLALTTAVLSYSKWSPSIVKTRSLEMTNHLLDILGLSKIVLN
jgi:uncharacterized protein with ParB-like and HNH nuclease domain